MYVPLNNDDDDDDDDDDDYVSRTAEIKIPMPHQETLSTVLNNY